MCSRLPPSAVSLEGERNPVLLSSLDGGDPVAIRGSAEDESWMEACGLMGSARGSSATPGSGRVFRDAIGMPLGDIDSTDGFGLSSEVGGGA